MAASPQPHHGGPPPRGPLVGRAETLAALRRELPRRRLLTLAGAGGMGKTRVAQALASAVAQDFADGVHFVDLSSLAEPRFVVGRVADALGLRAGDALDAAALAGLLAGRHMLLVLDNCEHLLAALAPLVALVLQRAPRTHILATSREPLAVAGERVHWLQPIAVPPDSAGDWEQAGTYPAVALFALRAQAVQPGFWLAAHNTALVAQLCRRLEGIPLAIELAAARSADLPLADLVAHIDAHLLHRSAQAPGGVARHDSVTGLLDWSHGLLDADQRLALRRLAVFQGAFDAAGAVAVACCPQVSPARLQEALAGLAMKSMLAVQPGHDPPRYAMLVTTRAYAADKLRTSDDDAPTMARFAGHLLAVFEEAAAQWSHMTRAQWLQAYGGRIDDVRLALRWSSAAGGDARMFVRLTLATVHLAYLASLLHEYRALVGQAIARLPELQDEARQYAARLHRTHGELVGQTVGPVDLMREAYARAVDLADSFGTAEERLRALDGAWMGAFISGGHTHALMLAQRCDALAQTIGEPGVQRRCQRMLAQSLQAAGAHAQAAQLAQRILDDRRVVHRGLEDSSIDPQVSARVVLARTLWVRGLADQAAEVAREAVQRSENDVGASMAHALAWAACPIALWRGELARAEPLLRQLLARSQALMPYWHAWGLCYEAVLALLRGTADAASVQARLQQVAEENPTYLDMAATLHPALLTTTVASRQRAGEAGWCAPEILRGQAIALHARGELRAADDVLERSLALAREQGAGAWLLRSATTGAQWRSARGEPGPALALLGPVRHALREGAATADLCRADALLARLQDGGGEAGYG